LVPLKAAETLAIVIEGVDMPGRSCATADARTYSNVHVGVQRGREVVELVPGDSPGAMWWFDVTVKCSDGDLDFRGPFVHGRRGDRFLYLSWGELAGDEFRMFRRAKLHFADAPEEVLASGLRTGALRCRVSMTDTCGNPRCARVRPPDGTWTGATSEGSPPFGGLPR